MSRDRRMIAISTYGKQQCDLRRMEIDIVEKIYFLQNVLKIVHET